MASEQVWVVAACFNEAEVISTFIERVMALPDVDRLLLIDDGSSDATVEVIRAWQQAHADQGVTLLELTRNFGKEAAMLAGLDYANGRSLKKAGGCGRPFKFHQKFLRVFYEQARTLQPPSPLRSSAVV